MSTTHNAVGMAAAAAPTVLPPSAHIHVSPQEMTMDMSDMSWLAETRNAPARAQIAEAIARYFEQHAMRIHLIDKIWLEKRQLAQEGKPKSLKAPAPIPPLGIFATTGLGKSREVRRVMELAYKKGLPALILVPHHELAAEYDADLSPKLGDAVKVYQGRREPEDGKDPGKHACYQLAPATEAGEKNHRPAQSLCRKCPHGAAGIIEFVRDQEKVEKAIKFLHSLNLNPEKVAPCQFLFRGLPEQMGAQIVIAPVQAFSEALAVWREVDPIYGYPIRETQRLIVVDENISPAKEVPINADDVAIWRRRLGGLKDTLQNTIESIRKKGDPDEQKDAEKIQKLIALLPEVDQVFAQLAATIAVDQLPDKDLSDKIVALAKKVGKLGGAPGGTAWWEKIVYDAEKNEFHIPLRALTTLAQNVKLGILRVRNAEDDDDDKGKLFIYEISPVLEWALENGSTVFMDATMGEDMQDLIQRAGGTICRVQAEQNMTVTHYMGKMFARGDVRKIEDYPALAKQRLSEIIEIAYGMQKPAAIITHKAYLKYSNDNYKYDPENAAEEQAEWFSSETGVKIGWYGKHDRGINDFTGCHLSLVGMPLLSKATIAGLYAATRSLMVSAGLGDQWPAWDGVMDKEKADAYGPPMPVEPRVRSWLIDLYAQHVAQAIGRARAVNHDGPPLQVAIYGGLQTDEMHEALRRYGIVVQCKNFWERSKPGPKADKGAVAEAVEAVLAEGGRVSKRSIREKLTQLGKAASNQAIQLYLQQARESGTLAPCKPGPVPTRSKPDYQGRDDQGQEKVASLPNPTDMVGEIATTGPETEKFGPKSYIDTYVGIRTDLHGPATGSGSSFLTLHHTTPLPLHKAHLSEVDQSVSVDPSAAGPSSLPLPEASHISAGPASTSTEPASSISESASTSTEPPTEPPAAPIASQPASEPAATPLEPPEPPSLADRAIQSATAAMRELSAFMRAAMYTTAGPTPLERAQRAKSMLERFFRGHKVPDAAVDHLVGALEDIRRRVSDAWLARRAEEEAVHLWEVAQQSAVMAARSPD